MFCLFLPGVLREDSPAVEVVWACWAARCVVLIEKAPEGSVPTGEPLRRDFDQLSSEDVLITLKTLLVYRYPGEMCVTGPVQLECLVESGCFGRRRAVGLID